jgi:hypothetical protein
MWTIAHQRATFSTPQLQLAVNFHEPWNGVELIQYQQHSLPNPPRILRAHVQALVADREPLCECYIRGRDLLATYQPAMQGKVRVQIYWRAWPEQPANSVPVGVQMILSAQTDLLDAAPQTQTSSVFNPMPAAQWCALRENAYLLSGLTDDVSYLEMIHPSDFAGVSLNQPSSPPSLAWTLFPERMEKGVIRRSRICGLLLPQQQDREQASLAMQQFAEEPLPLTT